MVIWLEMGANNLQKFRSSGCHHLHLHIASKKISPSGNQLTEVVLEYCPLNECSSSDGGSVLVPVY